MSHANADTRDGRAGPDDVRSPRSHPIDWRGWMSVVGRLLIAVGLLLLAFVAYQLWGTGLQQDRAQTRLADRFGELTDLVADPPDGSGTPAPDDTVPGDTTPGDTTPGDTTTERPTVAPIAVAAGDPIGIIEIPRIGVREYVVSGVEPADLRAGPGHFPTTPLPGELGNASIAGHRSTYGEPFANLDRLAPGDEIVVEMLGGRRYVYSVDSSIVVPPSAVEVVLTTDPEVARLTLTTCHPRWSASQRLVVSGTLVEETSSPPGDQAVVVMDNSATGDGATGDGATGGDTSGDAATGDGTSDAAVDAFDAGWFSDPAAWPYVVAWSAVTLAIGVAVWWTGRRLTARRRALSRRWPGAGRLSAIAAGAVPFLASLYLTFESISRLLPPDL